MSAGTGEWWRDLVGYEVYVRSFADADGDGVGDLPGILSRLGHLADLGVDVVWVTPFYPSPMLDAGYDVADYTGVEPRFGTLEDVDRLLHAVHEHGMRLLIDLVPNHTSSAHPWFAAARRAKDDPYRDYYVWRDPAPGGGPPNNWRSHFGGSAWTLDEATGQYWLHLFLPEQPDLNWTNPAVHDEFERILRFWLDRGIDGFRVDVAHALAKHPDMPDNPMAVVPDEYEQGSVTPDWDAQEHRYEVDQPAVVDIYRRWRKVADEYDAILLGEVFILDATLIDRYLTDEGLHLAFWFRPLFQRWDAGRLRRVLREGTDLAGRVAGGVGWVQGNHDISRATARWGGGPEGRARALAMATFMLLLPGMPFIYQGEELGLDDPVLRAEDADDPIAARAGAYERTRDVARTPMPWEPVTGLGFTTAERAWLPFGDRAAADTAAVQRDDPASPLSAYRRLLRTRRALLPLTEDLAWLTDEGPVLAYRRGGVVVAANTADTPAELDVPAGLTVRFSTHAAREGSPAGARLALEPAEAVVLGEKG